MHRALAKWAETRSCCFLPYTQQRAWTFQVRSHRRRPRGTYLQIELYFKQQNSSSQHRNETSNMSNWPDQWINEAATPLLGSCYSLVVTYFYFIRARFFYNLSFIKPLKLRWRRRKRIVAQCLVSWCEKILLTFHSLLLTGFLIANSRYDLHHSSNEVLRCVFFFDFGRCSLFVIQFLWCLSFTFWKGFESSNLNLLNLKPSPYLYWMLPSAPCWAFIG